MTSLEYRIGGLDPKNPTSFSKFILYKEDDRIWSIYALDQTRGKVFHRDVVEQFDLKEENVLGGGDYDYRKSSRDLIIDDYSDAFGSLPAPVAQRVGKTLAEHFRQSGVEITNVKVAMRNIFKTREKREMWRSLGFEV